MKSKPQDAMGEVLTLVRKSNLAEATALLRDALSGRATGSPASGPKGSPTLPPDDAARPAPARRRLGEVLEALRAARALHPSTPYAPDKRPEYPLDEKFTSR